MALCGEETFGPVVPLFRFADEAEVAQAANDTPFGLASYFYTHDIRRIERVLRVKESGYSREGSKYGLDDYLSIKYLCQGGLA